MNKESIKAYIESYCWRVEDLTGQELKRVEKEIEDQEKGMIILDSFLFTKPFMPSK